MRPSAWKMKQGHEDIYKGFLALMLVVPALFLLSTIGINSDGGTSRPLGNAFAQIEGDVRYPGVYSSNRQTDIGDLIEQAGGIRSDAPITGYPADISIPSGSKLTIQSDCNRPAVIIGEMSSFHKITMGMPVSVNMETEEGLTAVPGIGPVLARSIIKERNRRGAFKTLDDLKSVHGIGEKTYIKILTYVTL